MRDHEIRIANPGHRVQRHLRIGRHGSIHIDDDWQDVVLVLARRLRGTALLAALTEPARRFRPSGDDPLAALSRTIRVLRRSSVWRGPRRREFLRAERNRILFRQPSVSPVSLTLSRLRFHPRSRGRSSDGVRGAAHSRSRLPYGPLCCCAFSRSSHDEVPEITSCRSSLC